MSTSTVDVDGRRIRMRTAGDGEPVLLLHGIARSLEDWNEQFDRLAARFRLIALDLPGFAHSDPLERAGLEAYGAFLPRFLAAAGVPGPVHVVGNSLGGAVAMQLAVTRPDLARTLTLVNSAGFGREVTIALRLLGIRPLGRRLLTPSRNSARRTVRSIFADPAFVTPDRIEHALALASQPVHAETLLQVADSLGTVRGVSPRWRRDLLAALGPLRIPTLVVWGERDRVLPARHLEAALAALPHAEQHLFLATGHMPQIERADEFARLLTGFLARHPMRAGDQDAGPPTRLPAGSAIPPEFPLHKRAGTRMMRVWKCPSGPRSAPSWSAGPGSAPPSSTCSRPPGRTRPA